MSSTQIKLASKVLKWLPIRAIRPSPENNKIYKRIDRSDPAIQRMAQEMAAEGGPREPITVSLDNYIISGHRRFCAAKLAKLEKLECIILPIKHSDPEFVKELVRHNNQRVKTNAEHFREAVIATNQESAYKALKLAREAESLVDAPEIERIEFTKRVKRDRVSDRRQQFLDAVLKILNAYRTYWPLTARQLHYRLLNDPPLMDSSKDGRLKRDGTRAEVSTYKRDKASYNALIRLLRDARLQGLISWSAVDDPTRPVTVWQVWDNVGPYINNQLERFLLTYRRNLLQSQPNHVEIFAEKKTLESILKPIAGKYCMPLTIGSGCCSKAPIEKLVNRFQKSGKQKLVILAISDLDPAGEMISRSFCQRLRDDFYVLEDRIDARQVALTMDQVLDYDLEPGGHVDDKQDVNTKRFLERYPSGDIYEVEALEPDLLRDILDEAIRSVIDVEAYNSEILKERDDAQFLEAKRQTLLELSAELDDE
jgi:hypothetical protein